MFCGHTIFVDGQTGGRTDGLTFPTLTQVEPENYKDVKRSVFAEHGPDVPLSSAETIKARFSHDLHNSAVVGTLFATRVPANLLPAGTRVPVYWIPTGIAITRGYPGTH